ncbi:hypothetical protein KM043_011501 [Ampulex compressa]|nr:hypothetical protein KM043_011501 [Ampulex compressa]
MADTLSLPEKRIDNARPIISEVMFFSKDSALCRPHAIHGKSCGKSDCAVGYLRKMTDYLNSARYTLDVCMYFFTCQELASVIVDAQKRGVIVRIIIDEGMAHNNHNRMTLFRNNGIAVKSKRFDALMHHKFAIVDDDFVITGSTNWTMNAFFGNFDNILVTNDSSLVVPFVNEFERLWIMFDPLTSG